MCVCVCVCVRVLYGFVAVGAEAQNDRESIEYERNEQACERTTFGALILATR